MRSTWHIHSQYFWTSWSPSPLSNKIDDTHLWAPFPFPFRFYIICGNTQLTNADTIEMRGWKRHVRLFPSFFLLYNQSHFPCSVQLSVRFLHLRKKARSCRPTRKIWRSMISKEEKRRGKGKGREHTKRTNKGPPPSRIKKFRATEIRIKEDTRLYCDYAKRESFG